MKHSKIQRYNYNSSKSALRSIIPNCYQLRSDADTINLPDIGGDPDTWEYTATRERVPI